jgi:hypothetical protein
MQGHVEHNMSMHPEHTPSTDSSGRLQRYVPLRLGDAGVWKTPGCNGFPPKLFQPCASRMLGINARSRGASAPQRCMLRHCNRTFVFCYRMHGATSRASRPLWHGHPQPGHDISNMTGQRWRR